MGKLIYFVGLPGSGKSTLAASYQAMGYKVFSSDAIREELYGDKSVQDNPQKVFRILHSRIKEALCAGDNCVYDATNMRSKTRIAFLKEIKNIPCEKKCIVVWTSLKTCLERNTNRERKVPRHVIECMWKQFETPHYFEGWDMVELHIMEEEKEKYRRAREFCQNVTNSFSFNQENSHHTLSLGDHCERAFDNLKSEEETVVKACLFHDYGKIFTKSFYNKKGELCKDAHYYEHHNVGAYEILGVISDFKEALEVSLLICYHMHPYFWEGNSSMEKRYRMLWGEDIYRKICLIHEADKAAH